MIITKTKAFRISKNILRKSFGIVTHKNWLTKPYLLYVFNTLHDVTRHMCILDVSLITNMRVITFHPLVITHL